MNGTREQRAAAKRRLRSMTKAASRAFLAIDLDDPLALSEALEELDSDHRELAREVLVILNEEDATP